MKWGLRNCTGFKVDSCELQERLEKGGVSFRAAHTRTTFPGQYPPPREPRHFEYGVSFLYSISRHVHVYAFRIIGLGWDLGNISTWSKVSSLNTHHFMISSGVL